MPAILILHPDLTDSKSCFRFFGGNAHHFTVRSLSIVCVHNNPKRSANGFCEYKPNYATFLRHQQVVDPAGFVTIWQFSCAELPPNKTLNLFGFVQMCRMVLRSNAHNPRSVCKFSHDPLLRPSRESDSVQEHIMIRLVHLFIFLLARTVNHAAFAHLAVEIFLPKVEKELLLLAFDFSLLLWSLLVCQTIISPSQFVECRLKRALVHCGKILLWFSLRIALLQDRICILAHCSPSRRRWSNTRILVLLLSV
mmetsp:Transcript_37368/g.76669  ORF Transcript_37368/g.76669 Transcript_37368/m.76669 type:complete len:252 (+) Transcript_37368:334-1089(+)